MDPLIIAPTKNSPAIQFDPGKNIFSITGISIPEDASAFYIPVITWLAKHLPSIPPGSNFVFDLQYFNSSSLKAIYLVLLEIKKGSVPGSEHSITWTVEEDDEFMNEAAETFSDMLGMPLNVVKKS